MNKSLYWIGGVIVLFVVFLGAAAFFKNSSSNGLPIPGAEIVETDNVRGNGPVVLMEYSDFQCPACRSYFPIIEQLLAEEGSKITFVYRHFPLPQHGNALVSARAAEAAGKQGKFFEMYMKLFQNQEVWAGSSNPGPIFKGYATELALDLPKFDLDYEDPLVKGHVLNDYKSGVNLKVEGTPTFFVNGKKVDTPNNLAGFKELINSQLPSDGTTIKLDVSSPLP